jgi:AGZA family xanthine/uracil permease-like MFS transporter
VVGLLPGVAAWGALMIKHSLNAAWEWTGHAGPAVFTPALVPIFERKDVWLGGVFALEQGFIFTSMILAAVTVCIIERRFLQGAVWCAIAALLACLGLVHSFRWAAGDTVIDLRATAPWSNPWALGYLAMGTVLVLARWVTEPEQAA